MITIFSIEMHKAANDIMNGLDQMDWKPKDAKEQLAKEAGLFLRIGCLNYSYPNSKNDTKIGQIIRRSKGRRSRQGR